MKLPKKLRLGTRGSTLAIKQASMIKAMIESAYIQCRVELIPIKTTGDNRLEAISLLGGKGVFIKEIEDALLRDDIDIAVHSFKDITSTPHEQLEYSAFLLQERATDAFIAFNRSKNIAVDDCVIATGSMRRQALCQELYPNMTCVPIRGNIDTRIQKAKALGLDGLILSTAGLQRLSLDHLITYEPDPKKFIPAPGQGMLAIQHRKNNPALSHMLQDLVDPSMHKLGCQYFELLKGIAFNCNLPLGAYIDENQCHVFLKRNTSTYMIFPVCDMAEAIREIRSMVQ
jgi:hydroxymethylbilane synthase